MMATTPEAPKNPAAALVISDITLSSPSSSSPNEDATLSRVAARLLIDIRRDSTGASDSPRRRVVGPGRSSVHVTPLGPHQRIYVPSHHNRRRRVSPPRPSARLMMNSDDTARPQLDSRRRLCFPPQAMLFYSLDTPAPTRVVAREQYSPTSTRRRPPPRGPAPPPPLRREDPNPRPMMDSAAAVARLMACRDRLGRPEVTDASLHLIAAVAADASDIRGAGGNKTGGGGGGGRVLPTAARVPAAITACCFQYANSAGDQGGVRGEPEATKGPWLPTAAARLHPGQEVTRSKVSDHVLIVGTRGSGGGMGTSALVTVNSLLVKSMGGSGSGAGGAARHPSPMTGSTSDVTSERRTSRRPPHPCPRGARQSCPATPGHSAVSIYHHLPTHP